MRINDIAQMMINIDKFKRQSSMPNLPNGSLPPKGHVNPYSPPGMNITGMKASDFKIIPVSKEVEQQIKDMVLDDMKKYYGMSGPDGNNLSDAIKAYLPQIPVEDRKHAAHTLHQIHNAEARRLNDFVRSRVPGWQHGQHFDTSILDDYKQGINIKI